MRNLAQIVHPSCKIQENVGKCCERMSTGFNVAIDGPAGAGKSSVAKKVAEQLGFLYIDTGAMYRALTYAAIQEKIALDNEQQLVQLLKENSLELTPTEFGTTVYWNDSNITADIRSNDVNKHVSLVSSHKDVRLLMVEKQQQLAHAKNAVLDGRDIGTYVLPNADVKVFLTASVEERAKRRHLEQLEKGQPSDLKVLEKDIAKRDELDSTRSFAPLKQAEDAQIVDSTQMTIDEVIQTILALVKEHSV